jgi:tellurite resistance protein
MSKPANAAADFDKLAEQIRAELKVPKQNDVFRAAVEAGYLVACADGNFDDKERATLVKAVQTLSIGAVIEWETETLLDDCAARTKKDGADARAKAVGEELKTLGQAEAGLFAAAAVARATKGVDKKEADVIKVIGLAGGLSNDRIRAIVKRASLED